nr:hypothetical protein [Tanacetum cinerariifolium]
MLLSVSTVSLAELVPLLAASVMCGPLPAILQSLTNVLTLFLDTFISDFEDSTVTYTKSPPSPDYVYGPEHTPSPVYVPEFVLKPVYLKFMPSEDDVLLAEEKPLHAASGCSRGYLPPQKRLCIALGMRFKVGESSSAPTARPTRGFRAYYGFVDTLDDEIRRDPEREVDYGITDTWDEMFVGMSGAPTTDETELGRRMTDFFTTVRQDTDDVYLFL